MSTYRVGKGAKITKTERTYFTDDILLKAT